jgi:hypothetical protein
MQLSQLKLGDVINIQIQPNSRTISGGTIVRAMSGYATIIGIDNTPNDIRPLLIG